MQFGIRWQESSLGVGEAKPHLRVYAPLSIMRVCGGEGIVVVVVVVVVVVIVKMVNAWVGIWRGAQGWSVRLRAQCKMYLLLQTTTEK